jgi:CubicO group peptidase (beta-lactamase class C family)
MSYFAPLRSVAGFWLFLVVSWLGPAAGWAQARPAAGLFAVAPEVVVLRNEGEILPLQRLDTLRLATVMTRTQPVSFISYTTGIRPRILDYAPSTYFVGNQPGDLQKLRASNALLFILPDGSAANRVALQQLLALRKKLVVMVFDTASLAALPELRQATAVVLVQERSIYDCRQAIQVIFGGLSATGTLAPAVASRYGFGVGQATRGGIRLAYGSPAAAGLRDNLPALVDSLMHHALEAEAFPGAQVIIARHGVVALRRNYGAMFTKEDPFMGPPRVNDNTLYDFASLTKVTAALPALMLLQDRGLFGPDYTLGALFDFLQSTDKQKLRLRDVLTHQARLKAFIPFWQGYVEKNGGLQPQFFRPDSSAAFPLPVAENLWGSRALPGRIYQGVAASPLNVRPGYVYSDFSFMLYPYYVQKATGQLFDAFLAKEIYGPLGAATLGFNPLRRFPLGRIAPTEYDSLFRHALVHGTVHDENAAMLGGVSGHAGLFGNANDLAKLVQLYLWQGRYGGQQLIKPETMAAFTNCPFCPANRRGLGFDKPDPQNPALNAARSASPRSYGHTGFTGTYFWVEPEKDLFVILLTNRVNPTRRNGKLGELGVRSALLQLAIESALPGK